MKTLVSILVAVAVLVGAGSAQAESSIYVVDQPEISFVVEAKGEDVYVAYLEAEVLCYGAGGHWFEGPDAVTHHAFQVGPARLHPTQSGFRLVRTHEDAFESRREKITLEVQADRIVGTFSFDARGEAIQGTCEANAPGFEPESGEQEPPVPFEARRYVPLGSSFATTPEPGAEALYFRGTRQLEIILWASDSTVVRARGAARQTCTDRRGDGRLSGPRSNPPRRSRSMP